MDLALETPTIAKSPGFSPPAGPNYETVLQESIDRFLSEAQRGSCDLSGFRSVFFRLLQSSADPPLEVVWFYSTVSYLEIAPSKKAALDRVLAVRDLLQLLTACSASCSGPKCVALLAPALSELYKCAAEVERAVEKQKKVRREIESLAEGILSYISICSSKSSDGRDYSTGLLPCFVDLVQVWTMQRPGGGDGLGLFFPLASNDIRGRLGNEGCDVGYLAGVVIAEAFLLRLCLKVLAGGASRPELQKELRIWAVSSVTVFRNRIFFEILLRMLLDPTLPIISLLNSKDENLVRDILYDVVILVDYSFLNSGMEEEQSYDSTRSLALTRLIVTHEAIRIARAKGDHGKAISYINAFSTSSLPNGIVKLVGSQIGMERLNRPNATTPQAFLKWLVDLEEQGLRLFEDNISKLRTKLIFDEPKVVSEDSMFNSGSKRTDANDSLFFFDKQGEVSEKGAEDEEMEPMDSVFMTAARSMKSTMSNGRRKRKEWRSEEGEAHVKFVKYKTHDSSIKEYFSSSAADGMSSGSEVDNPPSDEDMEETEE